MIKNKLLLVLLTLTFPFYGSVAQHKTDPGIQTGPIKIDTLLSLEIGGIQQVISIKTDDARKPILLFLSGGPGSSMMNKAEAFTNLLKSKFTLVQWDQRDAGKTLKLNPSPVLPSVEKMKKDTYQVISFLLKELKQEKLHLLGSSWGNVLGFDVVKNHPELLHAYYAVNPVVSQLDSEQELLRILKAHFATDSLAIKELASVQIPFKVDEDLFYLRKWLFVKEGKAFAASDDFRNGFLQWSKNWSPVWNEVMAINLPKTLQQVDCPVYFFVGKNDIQTSTAITKAYFEMLKAPKKKLVIFENSGHQIHQDEPEKFQHSILQTL